MTDAELVNCLAAVVGPTFARGSATRSDLLVAAVSARAPTAVIQTLLELPERRFHAIEDVLSRPGGAAAR